MEYIHVAAAASPRLVCTDRGRGAVATLARAERSRATVARAATPRARNLQTSVQVAAPEPEPTPTTKPIFFAFGNGNVEPVAGGVLWGGYLETKNVKARAGTHKRRDASSLRAAWSGGRS